MMGGDEPDSLDWRMERIHQPVNNATCGVYRFTGSAQVRGERVPWSIILKIVQLADGIQASSDDPAHFNYWKREGLLYQLGMLDDLPGVAAPRCFGVVEQGDSTSIWLEDIQGAGTAPWPFDRYYWVAHKLGILNGHYLVGSSLPSHDFLSRRWVEGFVASWDPLRAAIPQLQGHPAFQRVWPGNALQRFNTLLGECKTFYAALNQLPHTFCHLDVFANNLMVRPDGNGDQQLVLVDWAFVGIAPIGAELASLIAAPPIFSGEDAHRMPGMERAAFEGYCDGLRASGWDRDPRLARLGYLASIAVRCGLFPFGVLAASEADTAEFAQRNGKPIDEFVDNLTFMSRFLLDRGDEARALIAAR
jgi:hypothetical protein